MVYKLLLGAALCLPLAACEQPALTWADAAPERTANPSPLAHPPFVPYDSTLRANTPYADFLETQDRLREAGAASLLFARVGAMAEATQTLTSAATIPSTGTGQATDARWRRRGADGLLRCARSLRIVTAGAATPSKDTDRSRPGGHGRPVGGFSHGGLARFRAGRADACHVARADSGGHARSGAA